MRPERERKTIQSAGGDPVPPHSCDYDFYFIFWPEKGRASHERGRWETQCDAAERPAWGDTFGTGCRSSMGELCFPIGNNFPSGRSLSTRSSSGNPRIDERSRHEEIPLTHVQLELEQDKSGAIFWKRPLETNKTFSERGLMSAASSSSSFFIPPDARAFVRTAGERYSVNRLWKRNTADVTIAVKTLSAWMPGKKRSSI